MVAITLLPVARADGRARSTSARRSSLGAVFLGLAVALAPRHDARARAKRLFYVLAAYLALLFVALALDPIVL